jgi:hypothetical protein
MNAPGLDWQVQGVGTFDKGREADIFWRNANGATAIWYYAQYDVGGLIRAA